MSLSFYRDKIPSKYRWLIHASEIENGYYIGSTKIADLGASTSELKRLGDAHQAYTKKLKEEQERNLLQGEIQKLADSKNKILQNQFVNIDSYFQRIELLKNDIESMLSRLEDGEVTNDLKKNIVAKVNKVVNTNVHIISEQHKKIADLIKMIEQITQCASDSKSQTKLKELKRQISNIKAFEANSIVSNSFDALNNLKENLRLASALISSVNVASKIIKQSSGQISESYVSRLLNLVEDFDFENGDKNREKIEKVQNLIQEIQNEIVSTAVAEKSLEQQVRMDVFISTLTRAKESIHYIEKPDYVNQCYSLQEEINDVISNLEIKTQSAKIRTRIQMISESIQKINIKGNINRGDYDELRSYKQELSNLSLSSDAYNSKKEIFDELYSKLQKICDETNTKFDIEFDEAKYQEQLRQMQKLYDDSRKSQIINNYRNRVNKFRERMKNKNFIALPIMSQVHKTDNESGKQYTMEVFYSPKRPYVVTVAIFLANGETFYESRPVILRHNNQDYYLLENEETAALVHENCKEIYDILDEEQVKVTAKDLNYFRIDGAAAQEYIKKCGLFQGDNGMNSNIYAHQVEVKVHYQPKAQVRHNSIMPRMRALNK